jgi:hypothetical protein
MRGFVSAPVVNAIGDDGEQIPRGHGQPDRNSACRSCQARRPSLGAIGAGPTRRWTDAGSRTRGARRAGREDAREHVAAYEAHQKKLAELADQLSGQKAIAQIKDLQAAFQSLTPTQQANRDVISNVLEQYVKLRQEVGFGVVPVLDNLFQQSLARTTDKAKAFAQQLMLTQS